MNCEDTLQRLTEKVCVENGRMGDTIPFYPVNGRYVDRSKENPCWWTNGFWGGMLWLLYRETGYAPLREGALRVEERLDDALTGFDGLHHDVGFMWMPTAVAHYRAEKELSSRNRALHAATLLAGRYNINGRFIRAWNHDMYGWSIIDTMMNLPLLRWASRETGDPRFCQIAEAHADTVLSHGLRTDGSCNHIVCFQPDTGEVLDTPAGQGYAPGSAWSRGQAWALYGFALAFRDTRYSRYLDAAKRCAHYFMAACSVLGWVPPVDFRAPREPEATDSSAGAIAACGLLEIADAVPAAEATLYRQGAEKIMEALLPLCDFSPETDGILGGGRSAYHKEEERNVSLIYGDYFYTEALFRLAGKMPICW